MPFYDIAGLVVEISTPPAEQKSKPVPTCARTKRGRRRT